ncbi:MAG TPA: MucB/RseB C-terminal domain-containing protein [Steroidobacteraceae bacterium]|nr:MucB/RseB C-terminal domain-containing protein [Steroidobacteraceae bacterium]
MRERLLTGICLVFVLSTAGAAEVDARTWLERMNRALATRNYDGTFFHLRNGKVETLRIIHRVDKGKVAERLVSLDSGREIVRNDKELTCYLPDQRRILVEPRQDPGPLLGTLPDFDAAVTENYKLEKLPSAQLLGRKTQVIAVNPNDAYRFGYRLWIDDETALPLKTQLCDERGNVVEQVLFANITLPDSIPMSAVRSQVDVRGLQWVKQPAPTQASAAVVQLWRAGKVPPGFRLTATNTQLMDGSTSPVAHLVYSDGLASVSVFIETKSPDREQLNGLARVGSAFAFSTTVRGHQVTAVGEVPAQTVQLIAHSTRPDVDAAAAGRQP